MQKVTHALVVLAAIALFAGVMPVLAQEQAKEAATVAQGQLLRVDVNAKTLAIRSSDVNQMQFRYTEQTKVVGGDRSVAGLATMAGSPVTDASRGARLQAPVGAASCSGARQTRAPPARNGPQ